MAKGNINHEGKVPMPIGGWEPSRQIGHEGEVRADIPTSWIPPDISPRGNGGDAGQVVVEPMAEVAENPMAPSMGGSRNISPRMVDIVELEARTYRLGGHTGTLSEEEHKEVLAVVARSIVRSLTEEAQRVQETYAMQQHLRPETGPVQAESGRGPEVVRSMSRASQAKVEALEDASS